MGVLSWVGWTLMGFGVIYLLYVPFWIVGIRPWIDLLGSGGAGWMFWITGLPGSSILGNLVIRRRMREAIIREWRRDQGPSG